MSLMVCDDITEDNRLNNSLLYCNYTCTFYSRIMQEVWCFSDILSPKGAACSSRRLEHLVDTAGKEADSERRERNVAASSGSNNPVNAAQTVRYHLLMQLVFCLLTFRSCSRVLFQVLLKGRELLVTVLFPQTHDLPFLKPNILTFLPLLPTF